MAAECDLRASRHRRASLGVANGGAAGGVHLLDNLEHAAKDAVLLRHC